MTVNSQPIIVYCLYSSFKALFITYKFEMVIYNWGYMLEDLCYLS